jgi:hypothetical protein
MKSKAFCLGLLGFWTFLSSNIKNETKSRNIVIRSTIYSYHRQNTSEFISKIFILNHVFDLCENLISHKVYLSKSLFSYTFDNIRLCEISLTFIVECEYINKNYKILFQSGILMVRMHISSVITYASTIISNKNTCVYYTFTKLLNDYSRCQTIAYKYFFTIHLLWTEHI